MVQYRDPGLGTKFSKKVNRLINEDGSYNIVRIGGIKGLKDFYKLLVDINWVFFFLFLLGGYILLNTIFALAYWLIGVDQLNGVSSELPDFLHAFFFSVQTFTTVGYGGLAPTGISANIVASIEAFVGLLSFAVATGLLYGRFSKPSSKIRFSKNIIIAPFESEKALMFKMVNERNNLLLNSKVETLLILDAKSHKNEFNKQYFKLKLETDFINFFPLTWTVVHKIDEKSPLYQLSLFEMKQRNAEVVVLVESFDETFGQTVFSRHSFGGDQWHENVKFSRNYSSNDEGQVILMVDEIDNLEKA